MNTAHTQRVETLVVGGGQAGLAVGYHLARRGRTFTIASHPNFNPDVAGNMPELNAPYAYWICWGVMLTIAGALILYFKRRGWFSNFSGIKD